MGEQTGATGAPEGNITDNDDSKQFEHITSQEEFDTRIQSRIARERSKFQDYDQLKADADELAKLRDAQKTDEQRRQESDAAKDRELEALRTDKLRREVAESKSDAATGVVVPAALLTGNTREELEASADALIAFRGDTKPQRPRVVVTHEGAQQQNAGLNDADRAFVGQLFQKND